MIHLRLFGRCRIYNDPVSPVLKEPAQIGWSSMFRTIDLVTPRKLKGKELLMRTRGWWTIEPTLVATVVEKHGQLMIGQKGQLMVELDNKKIAKELSSDLADHFDNQVFIAP